MGILNSGQNIHVLDENSGYIIALRDFKGGNVVSATDKLERLFSIRKQKGKGISISPCIDAMFIFSLYKHQV